jgi:preprotein translocase subunit SecG
MLTVLTAVHVLLALGLIGLILIQHGKGADVGAAFGSGASATVFGSQGAASFLTRTTAVLATLFFVNSLVLSLPAVNGRSDREQSVMERVQGLTDEPSVVQDIPPALPEDKPGAQPVADDLPPATVDGAGTSGQAALPAEDLPSMPSASDASADSEPAATGEPAPNSGAAGAGEVDPAGAGGESAGQ